MGWDGRSVGTCRESLGSYVMIHFFPLDVHLIRCLEVFDGLD